MSSNHDFRKKVTLNHLHRISGQLNALTKLIENGEGCEQIASLSTSIAKSFDTLRFRTLEGYIQNEIASKDIKSGKLIQLRKLLELYKK